MSVAAEPRGSARDGRPDRRWDRRWDHARPFLADAAVILAAAAVLGLVAGLVWPQLVDPVTVTLTDVGLSRDELALSQQFDAEAWYSLLAAAGGLLLGLVMLAWRRRHEVFSLLVVVAGGCLAGWLSAEIGTSLGPEDPTTVLEGAADGATASAQLVLAADVVLWVWPLFAVIGALLYLVSPLSEPPVQPPVQPAAQPPTNTDVSPDEHRAPPSRA